MHMDDNTVSSEILSTSFLRDLFHSSTSYNTLSTQLCTQQKRAAIFNIITIGAMISQSQKRVWLIEVDGKKEKPVRKSNEVQVNRLLIFHSFFLASKLPGYMAEVVLVENIQHCDPEKNDLLWKNIRGTI